MHGFISQTHKQTDAREIRWLSENECLSVLAVVVTYSLLPPFTRTSLWLLSFTYIAFSSSLFVSLALRFNDMDKLLNEAVSVNPALVVKQERKMPRRNTEFAVVQHGGPKSPRSARTESTVRDLVKPQQISPGSGSSSPGTSSGASSGGFSMSADEMRDYGSFMSPIYDVKRAQACFGKISQTSLESAEKLLK